MFTATLVLTLLGLALGGLLGLAAKFLTSGEENPLVSQIESLLPGSQCGQCGMPGCGPAAEAIANGVAAVNCCPPGGRSLAEKLATLMEVDLDSLGETAAPKIATIKESLCTGCTRCYKACPTDAIVGANKQIHAVIGSACTGCGKCEEICPENCIELAPEPETLHNWHWPKPQAA